MEKSSLYRRWHSWNFKRIRHNHVHYATLGVYVLVLGVFVFNQIKFVFAADLTDTWDFSTPSNFTLDSGLETSGSSVRLGAQEYSSDANTAALYHFNQSSGTSVTDSSSNNNTGTANSAPTWGAGNFNNAATLNGTSQQISVPDSSSLSFTGQHTIEGWFKPNSTFNNASQRSMKILDKGSYGIGLDRTSGKLTYQSQNANGGSWTKRLGPGMNNGSWTINHASVNQSVAYNNDVYTSLGTTAGDAEVWKWNGTSWTQVGGDGINGSWPDLAYEEVSSMIAIGDNLYAGLGVNSGDGEVWTCSLATSCTAWSKIGGDNIGPTIAMESITSMTNHNGALIVGTGLSVNDAIVYRYNGGTSWTQIGGAGVNSSWNTNYEAVRSLASDGTNIYAGLGDTTLDAEVWRYNGTSWTQIGGDGLNSSWNTNFESVSAMTMHGGNLYAGLGTGSTDAKLYMWNGTIWSQVGGDSINGSWANASGASQVSSLASNGSLLYVGLSNGGGQLWTMNGTTWTAIAGGAGGANGSWVSSTVTSVVFANGKIYAGAWSSNTGSYFMEWTGTGNWVMIGGRYINGSWGGYSLNQVNSSTTYNGKVYFGLNSGTTNVPGAYVYEYDGTTTTRIGGEGLNGSWVSSMGSTANYEGVTSMISYNGNLIVGLGNSGVDSEIWSWNGSTWTKVGGDGLSASWNGTLEAITSMAVMNGKLYVGGGINGVSSGQVWEWSGSGNWAMIGSTNVNGSWQFARHIVSMAVYNNELYVGTELLNTPGMGGVYKWNGGTSWTHVGGGANLNGSWTGANSNAVPTLAVYNGKLYAGVAELNTLNSSAWEYNGSTWTKVAGGGINGSWADGTYTRPYSMTVYNGNLYLGSGTTTPGNGDVWRWNGSSWSQIGGDTTNNSWAGATIEHVASMVVYKGKLYAGLGNSSIDTEVWSYGDNTYLESTTNSFTNQWYHFAIKYEAGTTKLYINGVEEASVAGANSVDNSLPMLLGNSYGTPTLGQSQEYFAGSLDEIRISNTPRSNLTTTPYSSDYKAVKLNNAVRTSGIDSWDGFAASETANGGSINYRLSSDSGATWQYWNGTSWTTSGALNQSNDKSTVDSHIATFPAGFGGITWQAVLKGDGTQRVQLDSVSIDANSDNDAPDTNASNIQASKTNGGASITANDWTNGGSPYFSWDTATDSGAGILGYCLYLGQTPSSDPVSTKGLLGTSPTNTNNNCAFATSSTNIDLGAASMLGSPLTSSSSPYYLNIKAIDNAGNISADSVQFQFRFDNTTPTNPGYLNAPSGYINTKSATLSWPITGDDAATDNHSGVVGVQYRIGASGTWYGDDHTGSGDITDLLDNDGTYTTTSPDPPDESSIQEGINLIYLRTWDEAGNVSQTYTTATLKVNTSSAPSAPNGLTPDPITNDENEFAFSWSAPNTFTGNAGSLTYCYSINSTPSSSNCTYTAAGVTSVPVDAYATQPGENTFYVVAKDEAGNINYSNRAEASFYADTPAPGMPTNMDVLDASIKDSSIWRLAITWDAPSYTGAGISSYKVYRSTDGVDYNLIGSSTSTSYVDGGLSQVDYYYKVKACDSANQCSAYSSVVDELPTGKYTEPANLTSEPEVSGVTTKKATIKWTTDRDSDSKISIGTKSGEYSQSEVGNSAQVTDHQIELDNLAAGTTYYLLAKWTDEDGNTDTSQEFTFTTSPAPLLKEVETLKVNLSGATVRFTTKSATKAVIYYGKSESFGGAEEVNTALSESTYSIALDGLDDGAKYLFKIGLFDTEGTEYQSSIFSFETPPRPRISNLRFQPVAEEPTSTQKITWQTNVPTTSGLTYGQVDTNGIDVQNNELKTEHSIIIKNLIDDSEYFLIAEGRDADGNLATSDEQRFKTALDTRPPKVSDILIETSIRGSGAEARGQIIVSWKTDEPASSQLAYAEGTNAQTFNNKTAEDGELTTDHLVIISDLQTSKAYTIMPISKDKSGNAGEGTGTPAIIGRASDSVLNIVLDTLRRIFGL